MSASILVAWAIGICGIAHPRWDAAVLHSIGLLVAFFVVGTAAKKGCLSLSMGCANVSLLC
jgi:hypothetical protein